MMKINNLFITKKYVIALYLFISGFVFAQISNINSGEELKYRISYSFLNAGIATLKTQETVYNDKPHLHVIGKGKSTGMVRAFFKVDDIYESYIDMETGLPSFYIRNISEGSYRRHFASTFYHEANTVSLYNMLGGDTRNFDIGENIQDMISSFYHLRSLSTDELKVGAQVEINMWIDDEIYPFMLKIVGVEEIKTNKFGKIECLKIIPLVMSGRVFKEKEGLSLWVSNDKNHIPIFMKADLMVGSLKADLVEYSNVKYNLNFK